ncbi:hypothetical protein Maq22A_1p32475 (plasmid) [Methylobacterium aquaticum]|uniref:Uncharacterized protein n=1 Tax=Methylobacterium aquaticum TaxID=270351 RepID=A0A0C6F7N5_9HYPH|nr:hypothetical protein Maq22A_1p32475 [Methylobacterium aquaticum]
MNRRFVERLNGYDFPTIARKRRKKKNIFQIPGGFVELSCSGPPVRCDITLVVRSGEGLGAGDQGKGSGPAGIVRPAPQRWLLSLGRPVLYEMPGVSALVSIHMANSLRQFHQI